ncbi:MAG: DUF2892 domain-containing protein [Bacteroidota bacterium]
MKINIGSTDRIVRIVLGVALLSLLFILEGNARYFGLIGIIPLATAAMKSCPLYSIAGISTLPAKAAKK